MRMTYTEAQRALITLQNCVARATDCYQLDVLERAMDEIVRNFENPKPAAWQVRSAQANAGKIVRQRRQLAPMPSLDAADLFQREPIDPIDKYAEAACREWLRTTNGLTHADRRLLIALYDGFDAVMIAATDHRPVERIREQISRARRKAQIPYEHALAA
jgi:DNA-directed RNA polymerase specialized sigma24 family protein